MARGLADVTVPAVAREAGVSVPTVYRHFGSKRALLAALQPYLQQRAGIEPDALPTSADGLRARLLSLLRGMDGLEEVTRAALASPAAEAVRRVHAPTRFKLARNLVDAIAPGLSAPHGDRVARLLVILTASAAVRMWREDFGASIEQVAAEIDQAVRAAIDSVHTEGAR